MNNFKIDVILKKHLVSISCYVLLSEKQRFRRFISQNMRKTARFFAVFIYFWAALKAYLASMTPSTTTLDQAFPPPIVGAPSSSGAAHAVSSSF
jgi:hypothetical protein